MEGKVEMCSGPQFWGKGQVTGENKPTWWLGFWGHWVCHPLAGKTEPRVITYKTNKAMMDRYGFDEGICEPQSVSWQLPL